MIKTITIYHNPKCSKSRKTLAILNATNCAIEIIEYLKASLSEKEVKAICKSLAMKAVDVVRTKGVIYHFIAQTFAAAKALRIL